MIFQKNKPTPTKTVDDLQKELLAVCRRRNSLVHYWRDDQGKIRWSIIRAERKRRAYIVSLREQIKALNPDAALYYGLAGPDDIKPGVTIIKRKGFY